MVGVHLSLGLPPIAFRTALLAICVLGAYSRIIQLSIGMLSRLAGGIGHANIGNQPSSGSSFCLPRILSNRVRPRAFYRFENRERSSYRLSRFYSQSDVPRNFNKLGFSSKCRDRKERGPLLALEV